jgi:four helix bundle protein
VTRGSLCELETQIIIAKELGFIANFELYNEVLSIIIEESKMINAFSKSLK